MPLGRKVRPTNWNYSIDQFTYIKLKHNLRTDRVKRSDMVGINRWPYMGSRRTMTPLPAYVTRCTTAYASDRDYRGFVAFLYCGRRTLFPIYFTVRYYITLPLCVWIKQKWYRIGLFDLTLSPQQYGIVHSTVDVMAFARNFKKRFGLAIFWVMSALMNIRK